MQKVPKLMVIRRRSLWSNFQNHAMSPLELVYKLTCISIPEQSCHSDEVRQRRMHVNSKVNLESWFYYRRRVRGGWVHEFQKTIDNIKWGITPSSEIRRRKGKWIKGKIVGIRGVNQNKSEQEIETEGCEIRKNQAKKNWPTCEQFRNTLIKRKRWIPRP